MLYDTTTLLIGISTIIIILTVYVLFLLTLQNTLKAINPENRLMDPGAVWRILIPFYNFYFIFVLVQRLASSIAAQLEACGEPLPDSRPTVNIGLLWAILTLINFFLNTLKFSDLSPLLSVGSIAALIIYWISVAGYKKKIQQHPVILLDAEREQMREGV